MSKKDFNYEKLNEILYDNNNVISYIRFKSYSLGDDEINTPYFLETNVDSNEISKDMFIVLYYINEGRDLDYISNNSLDSSLNKIIINLVEKGLLENLESIDIKKELDSFKSSQLKKLLKKHGIKAKGKRKELLKLAIENIPDSEFGPVNYQLTSKGKDFLIENDWINFYVLVLSEFDFNDFYKFVNENQGDMYKSGSDFLNLHIENAKRAHDFVYLDTCLNAKALIYNINADYENALNWELKRFILRLNPLYYSYINQYGEYLIFNPDNVYEINELFTELAITKYENVFYEVWDSLDLKNPYMSKEDTFKYLKKAFSEDLDVLSTEVSNKYFDTGEECFNLSIYYYKYHHILLSSDFLEFAIAENYNVRDALFYEALAVCHMKDFKLALGIVDEALDLNSDNGRYWLLKLLLILKRISINKLLNPLIKL